MADIVMVQQYLDGAEYPADKDELVRNARLKGANDSIIKALEALPIGNKYTSPKQVSDAVSLGFS